MDWINLLLNFFSAIIGGTLTAFIAYSFFIKRTKWELKYDALIQALSNLEKLKYISWQLSRKNDELTDLCLPSNKQTSEYINEIILETIESLIPLKILFNNGLSKVINSYDNKITKHFHQSYWDHHNEYPSSHDEFQNYMTEMELFQRHSLRIHKTTKAFIKLIKLKNLMP